MYRRFTRGATNQGVAEVQRIGLFGSPCPMKYDTNITTSRTFSATAKSFKLIFNSNNGSDSFQSSLGAQLSGELGHLRREMGEVELLQHENAGPSILRQSKQVISTGFKDLNTEREMPERVGGVRLPFGISRQTCRPNWPLEHL